jgi:ribose/xylose/arabinose/galactoside ABC-type transport system permease subunit
MVGIGRLFITLGVILVAVGLIFTLAERSPFKPGRLPGDIYIHGRNSSFFFPLTTCILISVVLSLVMWLLRH